MHTKEVKLLHSMLEASIHGVMLLNPVRKDGVVEDFIVAASNAAFRKQVGDKLQIEENVLLSSLFPLYKQYGFFDVYLKALTGQQVQHRQLFYKDDKINAWFDLGTAPLEDSVVVTFVNITESKEYQQAIERSARQLQAILDIAQSGIFIFSPVHDESGELTDFSFKLTNKSLASYVGQDPETLLGGLGSTWFPSYKKNGLFALYKDTCETGKTNRFDFHYNDDGINVWLDIMSTKLGDDVLVTFTDFTPIKQLQLQLEESVQNLKKSNENLEEFAYAASHDLQEPLRKIHFFSDRLKTRFLDVLNNEGAEMLRRMESAAVRMRTLIDDLLYFSRVSSKHSPFEEVNIKQLIGDVLIDLETALQEKHGLVELADLPTVHGDPVQLRQLFHNLLSNAIKYSHPARPPLIKVHSSKIKGKESPFPIPSTEQQKDFYLIEVSDNGLGFEQEHASRIFQIFQRLHGRSEYPGTGVGLAIVQKVVDNHRAYIGAQGEPDKGAVFRILFPA